MRILYVMAATAEYGPYLRARIEPLLCGVGPVESAVAVTHALALAQNSAGLPDLVVSLGSAGSRALEQGAIAQASTVAYRDMDASPIGFAKGQTPFLDLPVVVPVGPIVPGLVQASLSTGANIVSGAAYDGIAADMVDMETFAILRACQRFGVPLVAVRGISDGASELTHIGDWTAYLHVIDERLADVVELIQDWAAAGGPAR
jgi:adenosylhomocysteine nucleosidase